MKRMRFSGWWLVVAFAVVPLMEIYVLIQVGQVIGAWWTVLLLLLDSLIGGWLVKHEGRRAWEALSVALQSGRMPARELADGALILVGGTLMLTPGFVTDGFGILLILPFTRPVARRLLSRYLSTRIATGVVQPTRPQTTKGPGPGPDGSVVQGEVVDD
jgi:UPF0716 protein FxsA